MPPPAQIALSVFVGTSVDGFIARRNGDFDFLLEGGGEPHGYNEFLASVDTIVIGRKTFETVLTLKTWPYVDKRVVVLSSRPVDLSAAGGVVLSSWPGLPRRSFRNSLLLAPATFTSTVGSRFKGSFAQGSFNVSSSRACPCSLETVFLSSAACRAMFGSGT